MAQPKLVSNYITKAESLFHYHRIESKLKTINDTWDQSLTSTKEIVLNKVNSEVTELLINAEKECRHLYARAILFSPELSKAGLI